jgi:hypothetical protein
MQWLKSLLTPLRDAWFHADPRTLALFRLAFGTLCVVDIARRIPYIPLMYSDVGVLPNKSILEHPFNTQTFSLLFSFGGPVEAQIFFWLGLICAILFTVGYRTKLFHFLTAAVILSIHNKNILVENGGDQVMNIYMMWSLFLPLGDRFSVDSLIRSMRSRREITSAQMNDPEFLPRRTEPFVRLAIFAALVQLSVIYFYNTVSKSGNTWSQGTSIYYLLHQDRQITDFGLWMRDWAPIWLSKVLTFGTLAIEGLLPVLILLPIRKWSRRQLIGLGAVVLAAYIGAVAYRFAVFGRLQDQWPYAILPIAVLAPLAVIPSSRLVAYIHIWALHLGIAIVSNVGVFSFAMICSASLILADHDMDTLGNLIRRTCAGKVRALYDSEVGLFHGFARLLRRLDVFGMIEWVANDTELSPEEQAQRKGHALVVVRASDGKALHGHQAVAQLVGALPFGHLFRLPLAAPGLGHLLTAPLAWAASRRDAAATASNFHGIPPKDLTVASSAVPLPPSRLRRFGIGAGWALREGVVSAAMLAATIQMFNTNDFWTKVVPKWSQEQLGTEIKLTTTQPKLFSAWINYTRMFQKWNMFAPNVPKSEGWLVIDAKLADGRRIDPQTGAAPEFGPVDHDAGVDFGQMWRIYTKRIVKKRYKHFRPHLKDWLLSRHKLLELPPSERIVEFDVWWIRDVSPDPYKAKVPEAKEKKRIKVASHHPGKPPEPEEDDEEPPRKPKKSRAKTTTRAAADPASAPPAVAITP